MQCKTNQLQATHSNTKQRKTKHHNTKQRKAKQSKAKPDVATQSRRFGTEMCLRVSVWAETQPEWILWTRRVVLEHSRNPGSPPCPPSSNWSLPRSNRSHNPRVLVRKQLALAPVEQQLSPNWFRRRGVALNQSQNPAGPHLSRKYS